MEPSLSQRGREIVDDAPLPEYIDAHFAQTDDLYDARTNPEGYIGLAIAENKLVWPLLEPKLTVARRVPPTAVAYDTMIGSEAFRTSIARFVGERIAHRELDADQVAVLAGSGTVLEALFYVIADPGDAVLVPTPSYAGFWADLETRDALTVVPVHTTPDSGFTLTTDLLDAAFEASDRPVRALLYTNPSNPLGTVASAGEVFAVLAWARRRGIHVVVDEVFALSVFGDRPFVSASTEPLGADVHLVWAFSKDFAMSGLRCGVLVSENADVIGAVDGLAYWSAVSGDTQHLLDQMLRDTPWVDGFLDGARSRLRHAYEAAAERLAANGIAHHPSEAAFFTILDLRDHLDEPTWEAEDRLWRRFFEEARVNLTPGSACHIVEPGFMRLVFAAAPESHVREAVDRIGRLLRR